MIGLSTRFIEVRLKIITFALSLLAFSSGVYGAPNIIVITVDNLGYGDLGSFGNRFIRTPHLDALAREGMQLRQLYCASPICSPSRGALLTGRYPRRNRLVDVLPTEPQHPPEKGNLSVGLDHREVLLPELLKQVGYATGAIGKWHIGFAPGSRPTERGFDEYFGNASGNIDYFHHLYSGRPDIYRGTERVDVDGYSTDLYAEAAVDFIRRYRSGPFFLYLAFNAPCYNGPKNVPSGEEVQVWQAPADIIASYGPGAEFDQRKRYAAVITALDLATGRVLAELDNSGLRDSTLIIWWSDNGAFLMNERTGRGVASNGPFREGGTTVWEGGIRVPGIIRWPGKLPEGSVSEAPLISMDFFSLVLHAAGVSPPKDLIVDGINPLPILNEEEATPSRPLFWEFRAMSAIREGVYKAVRQRPDASWQLFRLDDDFAETIDLASREPERLNRLIMKFSSWQLETAGDTRRE